MKKVAIRVSGERVAVGIHSAVNTSRHLRKSKLSRVNLRARHRARSIFNTRILPSPAISADIAAAKPLIARRIKVITLSTLGLIVIPSLNPSV